MDSKADIRRAVRMLKDRIDGTAAKEAAERCFGNVARCPEFQEAHHILAYSSLPDEIPTEGFLCRWAGEKSLYLPRVDGDRLEILAYDSCRLATGAFRILEPTGDKICDVSEIDLIIVPAVAFDRNGNRLGRGKGYYDRLLRNAGCKKIGVAYDCQLLDRIPAEPHDVPMDIIVTDKEIIRTNQ